MDAREAMREICSILGVGDFTTVFTSEDVVVRVRSLAVERSEAHVLLDEACVAKHEPLPVRVGMLRDLVRRAQDGWAQANSRLDQSNEELVAARGDLRVERERADMLDRKRLESLEGCNEAQKRWEAVVAERDTMAARVKELEELIRSSLVVSGLTIRDDFDAARRVTVEFEFEPTSPRRDMTILLKDNGAMPVKPFAIPDPDVREMPFNRVTMAPPDTCDQSLTAALVEANRNTSKWRKRAQECQQVLRRIRAAVRVDVSYLDEDWGVDD